MKVDVVKQAEIFATQAHNSTGQIRKYSGEAYINHPRRVVKILKSVDADSKILAAAWLHDVVEDTPIKITTIYKHFGLEISKLVVELTNIVYRKNCYTKMTDAEQVLHLRNISPEGQTIKLADIIDNTWDLVDADPKKAEISLPRKRSIAKVLIKGNLELQKRTLDQIDSELKRLKVFEYV